MKKIISSFSVLPLAAVTLAACTADNVSAEPTPSTTIATVSEPTAEPLAITVTAEDVRKAWADTQINLYLNGNSKSVFADFNPETASHYITSWSSPKEGVFHLEVSGDQWDKCDLDSVGMWVMGTAGWETPEMTLVTVESDNATGSMDRDESSKYASPVSC